MKKLIFSIFCLLAATQAFSQTSIGTGIIYGPGHAYSLSAPDGWIMDNSAGVSMGLHAVFYPEGTTWLKSDVVMYPNFAGADSTSTLQDVIDSDIKYFKETGAKKTDFKKNITNKKGDKFALYYFEYTKDNIHSYEYIAYTRAKTGVIMLILHTQNKKLLNKHYKALTQLADSYLWIADEVKIEEKE